ncbi:MAG: ABC transporter ATP-binding protein [Synechococcales bacterium]|nr:ABC transporter ATP-binding protein [Synechococcales bacterium]
MTASSNFSSDPSRSPQSPTASVNDWRLFLRLKPYVLRNRTPLGLAVFLLLPSAIARAVQPLLIGQAISLLRQEPSAWSFLRSQPLSDGLMSLSLLLLLTMVGRLVLDASQGFLVQKAGQRITADIRYDLFAHVTALAVRFFDRTPVGKLITRLTSDVDALGEVFSAGAIGIISDFVLMMTILALMFIKQWQLASLLLVLLIPTALLIIYLQRRYRLANYKARDELSSLNAMLQENILGVGVVQIFRRERLNSELFNQVNRQYIQEIDATIFYDSAVSATLEWVALVAIAVVLAVGGWFILGDRLDIGTLSAFILFAQTLFDPLRQFAEKFTAIQAGFTAVERISDVLNEPIEIQDRAPSQNLQRAIDQPVRGEIRFEQVSFGYKPHEFVLHDLNFTIQPGEKVALVGPTGAGKSSIIRLLSRLYEPQQGRILLDGVDINDLPQAELRQRIGIILQDGFIFAGDVNSNITLGEQYSRDRIQAAAEKTNVALLIEQLPQGYNTQLRERGTNLSGGQKQLIAFARAAIRDPKILVLDEATASLDVGTEAQIQEALDRMLANRTAIIIAHRLSTIRNCDRILVLKRGRLVESGSHEALLAQEGLYASLYKLQMLDL